MTYSDAAKKYANETSANTGRWWTWYTNDLRAAFDAGVAHEHAEHDCPAEPPLSLVRSDDGVVLTWDGVDYERRPERLTDVADPRIRDGALVTVTFESSTTDHLTTYQYRIGQLSPGSAGSVQHVRDCVRCAVVRLLAEAPEPEPPHPDDAILAALATCGHDGQILADLRDEGYDIVRADR